MQITTYIELNPAQEEALKAFEKVTVRTALIKPYAIATFKSFNGQGIQLTIDELGIIKHVELIN
jgi:hypothetical protein